MRRDMYEWVDPFEPLDELYHYLNAEVSLIEERAYERCRRAEARLNGALAAIEAQAKGIAAVATFSPLFVLEPRK